MKPYMEYKETKSEQLSKGEPSLQECLSYFMLYGDLLFCVPHYYKGIKSEDLT